ncbi:hypothetical protein D3C78_1981230 [compost metagenome]
MLKLHAQAVSCRDTQHAIGIKLFDLPDAGIGILNGKVKFTRYREARLAGFNQGI